MPYTAQGTERIKVISTIGTSKCLTAGSKQTATIDMGFYRRIVVIGAALGTAATTTSAHATIKVIPSTALGTATTTAIVTNTIMIQTAGFWRYKTQEVRSDQIRPAGVTGTTRGQFVRVRIIWATRPAQVAFAVLGMDSRYDPQSNTVTVP